MTDTTLYLTEGNDGAAHAVPADLLELYEVLEWQAALADGVDATERAVRLNAAATGMRAAGLADVRAGIDLGGGVTLITRAQWGAKAPEHITPLAPSFGTTTHWEGPHMGVFDHASCFTKVRGIQAFHMGPQRGWSDIAYTSITCPHGFAFQCRWIGVRTAANGTNDGNNRAYAVCYLGGQGDAFTDQAKHAQRVTLDYLDRSGGAGPGRNCHRDWKQTECPGNIICAWVKAGQHDPLAHPTPIPPTPPTTGDDDVPFYHTIRCEGRPSLLVTNTGLRGSYTREQEPQLQAAAKELDEAGYTHGKSVTVASQVDYDLLAAPAPLTEADLLRIAAAIGRGFTTQDAAGHEDGLYTPDIVESARRGAVLAIEGRAP